MSPTSPAPMPLTVWLHTWLARSEASVKPETARAYWWAAGHLRRSTLCLIAVDALTRDHVRTLIAELFAAGLSPQSTERVVGTLRLVLNAAIDAGLVRSANVAQQAGRLMRGTRFGPRRAPIVLTDAQLARAVESVAGPLRAQFSTLMLLLARTGLRIGEALGLRWEDLDLERGVARVVRQWQPLRRVRTGEPAGTRGDEETPKSGKARTVGLSPQLAHALLALCGDAGAGQGWVFCNPVTRRPWSRSAVARHIARAARRAGLDPRLHPHAFRHSFATALHRRGFALREIQEALGHSTPGQTEDYIHRLGGIDLGVFRALDGPPPRHRRRSA